MHKYLRLHQSLRAGVVVLVVAVLSLINFVVVILFSHTYAQQAFLTIGTDVLNTIACVCQREEGWKWRVSSRSLVGACFQREGFVWARGVSPHF